MEENSIMKLFFLCRYQVCENIKSFLTDNYYIIEGILCVRWSPSGDMIASASSDKTVALLDFKTGKQLYTGNASDGSKFSLLNR